MKDLDNIKITNTNSTFSNDFIKKYTNFDNAKDFCNALGIYTLKDLDNIEYIPNIDELIAKIRRFLQSTITFILSRCFIVFFITGAMAVYIHFS